MSLCDITGRKVQPGDVIVYAMDRGILGQGVVQFVVPESSEGPAKITVVKPHSCMWYADRSVKDPVETVTVILRSTGHCYVTGETLEKFWERIKAYSAHLTSLRNLNR